MSYFQKNGFRTVPNRSSISSALSFSKLHTYIVTYSTSLYIKLNMFITNMIITWSFPLPHILFCLPSLSNELQWQQCVPIHLVLLATLPGFSQKTGFPTGTALLISIVIDCNYLTSPYIPRGTLREIVFAKCSFYLCKILQACSGVLLI